MKDKFIVKFKNWHCFS